MRYHTQSRSRALSLAHTSTHEYLVGKIEGEEAAGKTIVHFHHLRERSFISSIFVQYIEYMCPIHRVHVSYVSYICVLYVIYMCSIYHIYVSCISRVRRLFTSTTCERGASYHLYVCNKLNICVLYIVFMCPTVCIISNTYVLYIVYMCSICHIYVSCISRVTRLFTSTTCERGASYHLYGCNISNICVLYIVYMCPICHVYVSCMSYICVLYIAR